MVTWRQDEDNEGFNTSDEEFERQLEEAAMMEEQEKVEKARKPKVKKGRGRNARKKTRKVNNTNSVGETDGDGYEVDVFEFVTFIDCGLLCLRWQRYVFAVFVSLSVCKVSK